MAKSHSRSPRWRNRSLSPAYRSPEHPRQRYFQDHYDNEFKGFRKDPRRPMHWREEDRRYDQNNLRPVPRIYDYSPSPRHRTPSLDNPHKNKSERNYQPERGEITQRYSYPPKYPEIAGYRERERPFYQDKVHGMHLHEEPRVPRGDKRIKPYDGLDAFSKHEGGWLEGDLRHQRIQTEKYSYPPRRSSEEFVGRSSYQKRTAGSPSAERQISNDLVAVSRKKEDFHPVFEHIHSAPLDIKREFTQEIITIIHEVKANYFKPSALTLHERFSKMQHEKDANENKAVEKSNPEIHRRIDISLADLKSRHVKRSESGQAGTKVIDDPHDLRHDIERRRKERLCSEDEKVFDADVAERDDLSSSLSSVQNCKTVFEKSSRFMRAPFGKFVGKHHSSFSQDENTDHAYTHKRKFREDFDHSRANKRPRPFKGSFTENRFEYKLGLVQKGLHIQAKYQRLQSHASARGLTTNKSRDSFLTKREVHGKTGSEI